MEVGGKKWRNTDSNIEMRGDYCTSTVGVIAQFKGDWMERVLQLKKDSKIGHDARNGIDCLMRD